MEKRRKKKIMIFIGIVLILIGIVEVFFNISYSKTKNEFSTSVDSLISETGDLEDVFTMEDIAGLPAPVQKYFINCGYIGTPKMSYMKASYKNVNFILGRDKPHIKIDYTQFNFVNEPIRTALIDSSMFSIPFEGIDSYIDGTGSMKGVIAKLITLFDQGGSAMDKAGLVTCLGECFMVPNVALQDYITWKEIDDLHAKATISCFGTSASGVFTFNERGEMVSFITDDREATSMDGKSEKVTWTAICSDYRENNGIIKPTKLQAIWNYDEGDLLYFDSTDVVIEHY